MNPHMWPIVFGDRLWNQKRNSFWCSGNKRWVKPPRIPWHLWQHAPANLTSLWPLPSVRRQELDDWEVEPEYLHDPWEWYTFINHLSLESITCTCRSVYQSQISFGFLLGFILWQRCFAWCFFQIWLLESPWVPPATARTQGSWGDD